jgi:hypothetical protein
VSLEYPFIYFFLIFEKSEDVLCKRHYRIYRNLKQEGTRRVKLTGTGRQKGGMFWESTGPVNNIPSDPYTIRCGCPRHWVLRRCLPWSDRRKCPVLSQSLSFRPALESTEVAGDCKDNKFTFTKQKQQKNETGAFPALARRFYETGVQFPNLRLFWTRSDSKASVAQLVERLTSNHEVPSSNLGRSFLLVFIIW